MNEPGTKTHAKEQKVKTHKANNPEPIPERFIVTAHEYRTDEKWLRWRQGMPLDEWRAKYGRNKASDE